MTPQEHQLVTDLFDRLAQLENSARDPDAEDLIAELWDKAPNASYALVQSVIVQDEALKRANARIQELEAAQGVAPQQPAQGGSFLDGMREKMLGHSDTPRGSVPSVGAGSPPIEAPEYRSQPDPRWNSGSAYQPQQPQPQMMQQDPGPGGGSFLGTAASAAAGVVGGALLMRGISSLFGHSGGAHASAFDPGLSGAGSSSPWSGGGGDLAKQAGLDDIGHSGDQGVGLFGGSDNDLGGDPSNYDDGAIDSGDSE
jgi:hypothetical protein